jgi:tRNA (cytidine/uridine-2'-O-)-methyltransferase
MTASVGKYPRTLLNVVLVEPEIPNNTGNIGRTCVGLWSKLHLVGPLGFEINDTRLKRAGLDYWPNLDWAQYSSWSDFSLVLPTDQTRLHVVETGTSRSLYDVEFKEGDFLIFGKETVGFSHHLREKFSDRIAMIPFPGKIRSFNLANCVSMAMSTAYAQFLKADPALVHGGRPS